MNLQKIALRQMVEKALGDMSARARTKRVTLANHLPEVTVQADADRLQQVFGNLVDNAIKYGRIEGSVTVSGRALNNDTFEVCVQDDGPGNSQPNRWNACSSASTGSIKPAPGNKEAPGWDYPSSNTSSKATAAKSGPRASPAKEPRSSSPSPAQTKSVSPTAPRAGQLSRGGFQPEDFLRPG